MSVRHGRVLMVAPARTWSPVTAVLVRQITSAARAPLGTASPTTRAVTAAPATAPGCAAVAPASSAPTAPSTCVSWSRATTADHASTALASVLPASPDQRVTSTSATTPSAWYVTLYHLLCDRMIDWCDVIYVDS